MKLYRKQPIEADQFDGSSDLFMKYDMIDIGTMCEERHSPEIYMSGIDKKVNKVNIGDWIITDSFDHHELMTDEEFKQQYAGLPVIPKYIADYIELTQSKVTLFDAMDIILSGFETLPDCVSSNLDLFARAWLDGYQVEEK